MVASEPARVQNPPARRRILLSALRDGLQPLLRTSRADRMATVYFAGLDNKEHDVPDGTLLQQIIDKSGADIPFGCREGSCATCMIEVLAGMEFLNPPTDAEQTTLMPDELAQNVRLACQCRVSGGRIEIQKFDGDF